MPRPKGRTPMGSVAVVGIMRFVRVDCGFHYSVMPVHVLVIATFLLQVKKCVNQRFLLVRCQGLVFLSGYVVGHSVLSLQPVFLGCWRIELHKAIPTSEAEFLLDRSAETTQ